MLPISPAPTNEKANQAPELAALRLHQGSIWSWNRPIYDPADGGHLRIELRALPAGPTPADMLAYAALHSGLIRGLQEKMRELLPAMPFRYAEKNFYRAAKHGLDAQLIWPNPQRGRLEERPVVQLLQCLLPIAEDGLAKLGVCSTEIQSQLQLVRHSLEEKTNGARWQILSYRHLKRRLNREEALQKLVERYYDYSSKNIPVYQWSLED